MDCFDADVVIYAAAPDHPLGRPVASLFSAAAARALPAGAGSVLLLPEVLGKPLWDGAHDQVSVLAGLLSRLDLRPVDRATADLATVLSARHRAVRPLPTARRRRRAPGNGGRRRGGPVRDQQPSGLLLRHNRGRHHLSRCPPLTLPKLGEACLARSQDGRGAVGDLQLGEDRGEVVGHRLGREPQPGRDRGRRRLRRELQPGQHRRGQEDQQDRGRVC